MKHFRSFPSASIPRSLLAFLFVLLLTIQMAAQPINHYTSEIIPSSPEVSELGVYGDFPVDYSTGVPSISIPIYSIQQGLINLDISLNYHAGGLRVGQPSTWVGTGWNLNAGGMVSRIVQGIQDDGLNGYAAVYDDITEEDEIVDHNIYVQLANGSLDSEPDIFSYNFAGYSGNFIIDKNSDIQLIPQEDLQIETDIDNSVIMGFTITAPNGNRYIFGRLSSGSNGAYELTSKEAGDINFYTTGWYLVRIESWDLAHKIDLTYTPNNYSFKYLGTERHVQQYCFIDSTGESAQIDNCGSGCAKTSEIQSQKLSTITNSSGTAQITFLANTDRLDLDGTAKRLDGIEIQSGGYCNEYQFNYDYFLDDAIPNQSSHKRLKLEAVQQKSCDGTVIIPPYRFHYQGPVNDGISFLPNLLSRRIDHWGYYNGATNNDDIWLNIPPSETIIYMGEVYQYGSANRETNETYSLYGALDTIYFPTGGYTHFEMESNSFDTVKLENTETLIQLRNSFQPTERSCYDSTSSEVISFNSQDDIDNAYVTLDFYYGEPLCTLCKDIVGPSNISIVVLEETTQEEIGRWTPSIETVCGTYFHNSIPLDSLATSDEFKIKVGYEFVFTSGKGTAQFELFLGDNIHFDSLVGGLRVKKIVTHDGIDVANDIIRSYQYEKELSSGEIVSSGNLKWYPQYASNTYDSPIGVMQVDGDVLSTILFGEFSSQINVPNSSFRKGHIIYEEVTELFKNYGSITREYFVDPTPEIPVRLAAPALLEVNEGHLKRESHYDESGELVYELTNTPIDISYNVIDGNMFKVGDLGMVCRYIEPISGDVHTTYYYTSRTYQIRTSHYNLESVIRTRDGVFTKEEYAYDQGERHFFPIRKSTLNLNDETEREDDYRYVFDYENTNIANDLIAANRIASPYQTTIHVNGTTVDGQRTLFSYYDNRGVTNSGDMPYPHLLQRYEVTWDDSDVLIDNGWQTGGTIDIYDLLWGFPSMFTVDGWDSETYVWNDIGLLESRNFSNYTWSYNYHDGTPLLETITDIDMQAVYFSYDQLMRLTEKSARDGNVVTSNEYYYSNGTVDDHSFIKTTTDFTPVAGSDLSTKSIIQYYDGIGRPIQLIDIAHSVDSKDIVVFTDYNDGGKVERVSEPFESTFSDGAFIPDPPSEPNLYYTEHTYEPSPLGRITSTTPANWYPTQFEYTSNTAGEVFDYDANQDYPANALYLIKTTNPDQNTTSEYTSILDTKVLQKRSDDAEQQSNDTYFLYDDKRRNKTILPPGSTLESSSDELRFEYLFDAKDNVIFQKAPSSATVEMLYNERNLLTYVLDGISDWQHFKYDLHGREIESGFVDSQPPNGNYNAPFTDMLTHRDYDGANEPIEIGKLMNQMAVNLQDYSQQLSQSFTYDAYGRVVATQGNHIVPTSDLDAVVTQTKYDYSDIPLVNRRIVDYELDTHTSIDSFIYDHAGRMVDHYVTIDASERHVSYQSYNHKDELIRKKIGQSKASSNNYWLQSINYEYLENGFLQSMNSPVKNGNFTLIKCPPYLGSIPAIPSENPDNNYMFYLELAYDIPINDDIDTEPMYNGNISQMAWGVRGREKQAYGFTYDYLDRITAGSYYQVAGDDVVTPLDSAYGVTMQYDARGNPTTIQRFSLIPDTSPDCWSFGVIDNLSFTYNQNNNRIQNITDRADAAHRDRGYPYYEVGAKGYGYDANGNIISDPSRNASIFYNYLNLPDSIAFIGDSSIRYSYDAAGNKWAQETFVSGVSQVKRQYIENMQFLGIDGGTASIDAMNHSEGRVVLTDESDWQWEYSLKDHLGNVRVTFSDLNFNGTIENATEILEEYHYYPFGMQMEGPWISVPDELDQNRYRYNGKEFTGDFGLEWYDYGARWYDPSIGRFTGVDPISDQFPNVSTYNYAENSPIANIDLWGRQAYSIHGTNSDPSTFNSMSDDDLNSFGGNQSKPNRDFSWESKNGFDNSFLNDEGDRGEAAQALATHVLGSMKDGENITLIGHSHGGNVAIRAVDIIRDGLDEGDGRSINLVTIATPAYNGANDVENPANTSADSHTQFYSKHDGVQTTGANLFGSKDAGRTYSNPATNNILVNDSNLNRSSDPLNPGMTRSSPLGPVEAHFIHTRPQLLKKND